MDILVIEPFYGGSHAQLIKVLLSDPTIGPRIKVFTLPAKKWHWKARTSALHFSQVIEPSLNYRLLLSTSVLNLTELVALRPDLARLWKVVYFHENQLVYPVRKHQDRDFQYGYNQITTSLVADDVVFNSEFNKESFLRSISGHLKLIPDHRPKNLEAKIRPKCRVIYFPVDYQNDSDNITNEDSPKASHEQTMNAESRESQLSLKSDFPKSDNLSIDGCKDINPELECRHSGSDVENIHSSTVDLPSLSNCRLHIVWPHRWEHDKDPETFFNTLFQLQEEGYDFSVSVLGESYLEIPEIFNTAKERLGDRVLAWGFQSKDVYKKILDSAHVAVSTANHEFFGVSMLEAASRGCFPLCPKKLAYPEIYPDECLYSTQTQLIKRLKKFSKRPDKIPVPKINFERFSWKYLRASYHQMLKCRS